MHLEKVTQKGACGSFFLLTMSQIESGLLLKHDIIFILTFPSRAAIAGIVAIISLRSYTLIAFLRNASLLPHISKIV